MQTFGKYQIVEELGRGTMGVVYKAVDTRIERLVALKVMNRSLSQDPEFQQRFEREAKSTGRLQHPNIVTVYDFGDFDGCSYLAMEFLDGQSLEEVLETRRAAVPLLTKLQWVSQICYGLEHAHQQNVVHRDIKPANIRLTKTGQIKIVDFGLARLAGSNLTGTGKVFGSPSYMSPEQVHSSRDVDGRSDQFSAGIILFELLTGQLPFTGDSIPAILLQIANAPHRRLEDSWPEAPSALVAIVDRALAKNPAERFPNCGELAQRLEAFGKNDMTYLSANPMPEPKAPAFLRPPQSRSSFNTYWYTAGILLLLVGLYAFVSLTAPHPPGVQPAGISSPSTSIVSRSDARPSPSPSPGNQTAAPPKTDSPASAAALSGMPASAKTAIPAPPPYPRAQRAGQPPPSTTIPEIPRETLPPAADNNPAALPSVEVAPPQPVPISANNAESMLLRRVEPTYPELAKRARVQGVVLLQVTVDETGMVTEVSVLQGNPLLNQAAVDAVRQWRYRPFQQHGQPVACMTTVTVIFNLR